MADMKVYKVQKYTGETVSVEATTKSVAVAKAHKLITGQKASSKDVTWNGVHWECKGLRYNTPIVVWAKVI